MTVEGRAGIMNQKINVTQCFLCPFNCNDYECSITIKPLLNEHDLFPDWCPLLSGEITVSANAEKDTEDENVS